MSRRQMISALVIAVGIGYAPSAWSQAVKTQDQAKPAQKAQRTAEKTSRTGPRTEPWKKIPIPPLPEFKPAQPTRIELPNGMVIFLQEDHELPLINLSTMIRGGSRLEPAAKVGLVDMYGDVWRTGGTAKRTGDEMDDFLEARAAKLETGGGGASTSIGFSCLKQDLNDVYALYVELLREPAFREDKIKLAADQMRTGISRRNDDSDSIAAREAAQLVYGEQSPYARVPEYSTVAAVTRQDMVNWHKEHVGPQNMIVGVVGDFDSKEMEARLRKTFEGWPKSTRTQRPDIKVPGPKPGVYLVEKDDVNQSELRIVGVGIQRDNPDYFAVSVMNEIFGGGFASRLFSNLRTKRGLAYSVGGGVGSGWDRPGMIVLTMGTKSETTVEGIQALYSEIDDLVKNPATPAELKRAKDAILNSFIFNFDTPAEVMQERMVYEFYGYPLDFLERYRAAIEKVTAEDVARVARKYVHKEELAALVVGNVNEFGTPLTRLGQVIPVDITIPGPGQGATSGEAGGTTAPPAPKASNAEGKALIGKVVQFLGGQEKVQSVKSIRQKLTSVRKTPQGDLPIEVEQTIVYPDKLAAIANLMGMEMRNITTPDSSFMVTPQGVREMTGANKDESQRVVQRDVLNIAKQAGSPDFIFAANGTQKVGNTEAEVLDIAGRGMNMRWLIDPKTGAVLQSKAETLGQAGPVERTTEYGSWKPFDGLQLYTERKIIENGEQMASDTIEEWVVNPQVDPKLFEKPAAPAAAAPQ